MYQSVWRSLDHTGASPPLPVESTAAGRAGESGGAIAAVEHGSSAEVTCQSSERRPAGAVLS